MRKLSILSGLLCAYLLVSGQISIPQKRCATYEVIEGQRKLNSNMQTDEQFEAWIKQAMLAQSSHRLNVTVTLPVVFHIIHDNDPLGTGDNIATAAIHQQLMQLNKDFANQSYSPYAVSRDMEIQFALAQTDPGGSNLADPGIDRINRSSRGFIAPPYTVGYANPLSDYFTTVIKPATIWDPERYLNIWVLEMEAGILGIATFPSIALPGIGGGDTPLTAGAAVAPASVGSVFAPTGGCNAPYGKGRTLTHELGHFFGLRHIWGDGICASDFCDDTPVHQTANTGVPSHPKPNACGTADEMFENYMDYCDDRALNTFTADQKARMQAVMASAPRRANLATSTVGLIPVTGNRISFYDCTGALTVSETGTFGTYPRYREVSLGLQVENQATGSATVTINPTGTAVNGYHYQVLTPSISFATGDISSTVVVRIFDNAQVESSRTITLGYTISGTGVTAGSTAQTVTITITDDDNITVSETPVTLLTQDFETTVAGWQSLSTGGDNHWVVSNAGNAGGSGNCAYVSITPGGAPAAASNTYNHNQAALAVLVTPVLNTTGYSDLQLSFKYRVWGEEDADDIYDFGAAVYSLPSAPNSFSVIPAANTGPYVGEIGPVSGTATINLPNGIFSNNSFHLGFYWENDGAIGNNPALNIDDVVLTGNATRIETTVSNSYGFDLRSGTTTNKFRSTSNNRIIADVLNVDAAISGLTASVTQAGNGTVSFTTPAGSFFRSQKVIQLTPSVANTTATYQVVLYFTTAELAAWGSGVSTLRVLKVNDGVNLAGSLTTANAQLATSTVVDDQRATLGYARFTANFTGGFSQFMLVSSNTSLPVDLITFEAKPLRKSILLNWSTAQELNNKGFVIERSTTGNAADFQDIAWVDGKINTSSRSDYSFTDHFVHPGTTYYYRLRQTDLDERTRLSLVRQAKIEEGGLSLTVNPNPASGQVSIFVSGAKAPADLTLINMQGQVVRKWSQVNASAAPYALNINGLASGVYTLQVWVSDQKLSQKLVVR